MDTGRHTGSDVLDLAVIGAGAAGTYAAQRMQLARPDWSIALLERTDRIGGRLRSLRVTGIDHPVELGGMRFLTSHRLVTDVVSSFGLPTHPFDTTGGAERSFLRGHFGNGPGDPSAGDGYDLAAHERGRSAQALGLAAFERIIPGATTLTPGEWVQVRADHEYLGRPVTDWAMAEALATVLSPDAYRFLADAFGYDSGPRAFNVADGIEYIVGAGDPRGEARTPDAGMDAIPLALAAAFSEAGGTVRLRHELVDLHLADGGHRLRFANGAEVLARRVVLTIPVPSLRLLADASRTLDVPGYRGILESVEAFPAIKAYLWYDRPWWRDAGTAMRMTTDLPPRKLWYFGSEPDRPAAVLAAYTDGRHTEPWRRFIDGPVTVGAPVPGPMLAEVERYLRRIHPTIAEVPSPVGSAMSDWGGDPHETGWTFWRAGFVSDAVMRSAIRPIPGVALFVCGEAFSRAQGWVEGAFETAQAVVGALT